MTNERAGRKKSWWIKTCTAFAGKCCSGLDKSKVAFVLQIVRQMWDL